jgi:hypothetical protein
LARNRNTILYVFVARCPTILRRSLKLEFAPQASDFFSPKKQDINDKISLIPNSDTVSGALDGRFTRDVRDGAKHKGNDAVLLIAAS